MAHQPPSVSIGLPVYNGENYIKLTLDSILGQSFRDFELIISDNASVDGTQEICMEYAERDARIRYTRTQQNVGAARNYNRIFPLATGRYFKWSAYDEYCAPGFLERCVTSLDAEPNAVLCYSRTNLIDGKGDVIEPYSDGLDLRSPHPHQRFSQLIHTKSLCNPIFGLIRSDVLRKTPLIADYPHSDRTLLGELSLHGQFIEMPEYLFYRRVHAGISTEANVSEIDLAAWFNPARRRKINYPRWRRFSEYLRSVHRAPISNGEKLRSYLAIGKLAFETNKWLGLGDDLLTAARIKVGMIRNARLKQGEQ